MTAVYGGYDHLSRQVDQDIEVEWICFTDSTDQEVPAPFRRVVFPPLSREAVDGSSAARANLSAKRFKLTPWQFLDHERVIWIDANMEIVAAGFAREALASTRDGVAFFRHPRRSCVYKEAEALLGLESQGGKFADQPITEQIDSYRADGYPESHGLWASGVIAWELSEPKARRLGSEWMSEVELWSVRDQLSLPVVVWRLGMEPGLYPLPLIEDSPDPEYLGNQWLRIWPHGYSVPPPALTFAQGDGGSAELAVASVLAMSDASAEQRESVPRYDFEGIDLDSDSVHADVVKLVDEGSRVLELGPATGYMTQTFKERGCAVVGIELDPEMAAMAEQFTERMIVGDIDRLDLDSELGEERFDAIVAADVLEHLRDPVKVLLALKKFLNPDGCFVISFPNVAHGSVRLSLLSGHFDYQDIGLLDSTHLRFFTRESFEELLDEAELGLAVLHRHELNLDASEVPFDAETVPPELRERLEDDPDARTYQYVVKALPMSRPGLREIQGRMRELAELREVSDEVEVLNTRIAEMEAAMAAIGGREGELRRALIDAHDQLLRRDAEIESMHQAALARDKDLDNVRAELDRVNGELVAALGGLRRIRTSAPYRVLAALKSLLRR